MGQFCNVLPVFDFNSTKYDLNLIKPYLLPILVDERDIEPTVIKIVNQFNSLKFSDNQVLDLMKIFVEATSPYSFLKAYKTSKTKEFFLYDWFDHTEKMQKTEIPPYEAFCSKLRSCNPLEAEYIACVNLLKTGLTTEHAIVK